MMQCERYRAVKGSKGPDKWSHAGVLASEILYLFPKLEASRLMINLI